MSFHPIFIIIYHLSSNIEGYYVTIPALQTMSYHHRYFRYQLDIIRHLKSKRKLMMTAFELHQCVIRTSLDKFKSELKADNY